MTRNLEFLLLGMTHPYGGDGEGQLKMIKARQSNADNNELYSCAAMRKKDVARMLFGIPQGLKTYDLRTWGPKSHGSPRPGHDHATDPNSHPELYSK